MSRNLAFVSSLPLCVSSGGVTAISRRTFDLLQRRFGAVSPIHIKPARAAAPELWSRFVRRALRRPGKFDCFSDGNLEATAARLRRQLTMDAGAVFFRGTTPWIGFRPEVPYFAYTDMGFRQYFENTFPPGAFLRDDVERIVRREAEWLEGAAAVFFESRWGLDATRTGCGVASERFLSVGCGGHVRVPDCDRYAGGHRLLFIAKRFRQKGGDVVLDAYVRLRDRWPDLGLDIVGGEPDRCATSLPRVTYHGFLNKDRDTDLRRLERLLEESFLLVHPTREDCNPLVITEAAYFGCPSVSMKRFAIPELVKDGVSGVLLDAPPDAVRVAQAVEGLLRDGARYRAMRDRAREHALRTATWEIVGDRICREIKRVLA